MKKVVTLLVLLGVEVVLLSLIAIGAVFAMTVFQAVGGVLGGVLGVLTFLGYSRVLDGVFGRFVTTGSAGVGR